jgi:hypothetical protein
MKLKNLHLDREKVYFKKQFNKKELAWFKMKMIINWEMKV